MFFYTSFNHIIDTLVSPFSGVPAVLCLLALGLVSAVILLTIFKKLSNQDKIKQHKNKIFGLFLEIALYRDDFRRTIINQLSILKHNALYMRYFSTPILIMFVPMLLVCMQLEYRLGNQPLREGDSFIIQAQLDGSSNTSDEISSALQIETSEGIILETRQLHDTSSGNFFWRANLSKASNKDFIKITLPNLNASVTKKIATELSRPKRFSAEKKKLQSLSDILYSGEDSIPTDSPIQSIRVTYKPAEYPFFFWNFSAIIYYALSTLSIGLCIKPFMKVNI